MTGARTQRKARTNCCSLLWAVFNIAAVCTPWTSTHTPDRLLLRNRAHHAPQTRTFNHTRRTRILSHLTHFFRRRAELSPLDTTSHLLITQRPSDHLPLGARDQPRRLSPMAHTRAHTHLSRSHLIKSEHTSRLTRISAASHASLLSSTSSPLPQQAVKHRDHRTQPLVASLIHSLLVIIGSPGAHFMMSTSSVSHGCGCSPHAAVCRLMRRSARAPCRRCAATPAR